MRRQRCRQKHDAGIGRRLGEKKKKKGKENKEGEEEEEEGQKKKRDDNDENKRRNIPKMDDMNYWEETNKRKGMEKEERTR